MQILIKAVYLFLDVFNLLLQVTQLVCHYYTCFLCFLMQVSLVLCSSEELFLSLQDSNLTNTVFYRANVTEY